MYAKLQQQIEILLLHFRASIRYFPNKVANGRGSRKLARKSTARPAQSVRSTLSGKRKNQQKPALVRIKVNANGLPIYG